MVARGKIVLFCTGTFERTLDGKLRLLLPKTVKSFLTEDGQIFIAPGVDGCLELHNQESLKQTAQRAESSAAGSRRKKMFSRMFFAQSETCQLDGQGRIRLPQRLVEMAGLENRIAILGVGSHWEIWNQTSWNSFLEENQQDFDQISESTFDGDHVVSESNVNNVGNSLTDSNSDSNSQFGGSGLGNKPR